MTTLDHATCCDVAEAEILRLADVIRGADLATPVPTCPGWTLAELVTHLGGVHRWAAIMVSQLSPTRVRRNELDLGVPDDPAGLPDWLAAGAALTATAFRASDPDASMWAWGADKHARFWPRRMVHETVVHRADAELALGRPFAVEPDVAADGIDELLDNLPYAVDNLSGAGEAIAFVMLGVTAWRIELLPDGFSWSRADGPAAVTVTAAPADLLLVIYGRRNGGDDGVTIDGDTALFERWIANSSI
jgi:uncharacterized protein (TIGR03083 family)